MHTSAKLAPALGWLGIALGAIEIAAPKRFARAIGTNDHSTLVRAFGAREIVSGVGILSRRNGAEGMWMRVGGDALDLAVLALALRNRNNDRRRLCVAIAAAGAVGLADLYTALAATGSAKHVPRRAAVVKTVSMMTSAENLFETLSDPSWLRENVPGLSRANIEVIDSSAPATLHYRVAGLPSGLTTTLRASLSSQGDDRGTVLQIEALPGAKCGSPAARRLVRAVAELPGDALALGLHRLKNIVEVGEIISADGPSGRSTTKGGRAR